MYHHYMLVGKIGTCWLVKSVHASMYQKPVRDGRMGWVCFGGNSLLTWGDMRCKLAGSSILQF